MLGRLFKLSTAPNLGSPSQNQQLHSAANTAPNTTTYDDSYTREILYASQSLSAKTPGPNPRRFRLVVCQDGGNLRSKQVLFDLAAELAPGLPGMSPGVPGSPVSASAPTEAAFLDKMAAVSLSRTLSSAKLAAGPKNILLSKQLYNVNDINDYMFGRGLPTNESTCATKIHILPVVNLVYGAYRAVLVTRLFLIIDENNSYTDSVSCDPEWHPQAALPVKDAYFGHSGGPDKDMGGQMAARWLFHSRFALGIVIPLESPDQTVSEVLGSHWDVVSQYLVILLKVVTKKLILALKYSTVNQVCPYITNRRIQFPPNILRADAELGNQLGKLVRLVYFSSNVPRLMSLNLLIRHSISHPDSRFKALLLSWALEAVNWLEFKDGRTFKDRDLSMSKQTLARTFLANLLALLVPLKQLLAVSPVSLTNGHEAGQMNSRNCEKDTANAHRDVTRVVVMTGNSAVAKKLIFILNGLIPDADLVSTMETHNSDDSLESECAVDDTDTETQPIPIVAPPKLPLGPQSASHSPEHPDFAGSSAVPLSKPIPIRKNPLPDSPVELSSSVSSTRGWEVPVKTSTSLSFSSAKKPSFTRETQAQQIPTVGRSSVSNLSMAYLSSSLNSSLSSSASNYSLSKLGGSFVDKWKHSFGHPQPQESLDMGPDYLGKRPQVLSLRTPSPALDLDEPLWETGVDALLPPRLRISRTQSMLDLYQHGIRRPNGVTAVSVQRTMSSVYVPLHGENGPPTSESNSGAIKRKCGAIMQAHVEATPVSGLVVAVDPVMHASSSVLDQSTLTSQKHLTEQTRISRRCVLPPTVAFVEEFRPEYAIQSCPVSSKLEPHVMNAMKNDLLFFQNNCGYERVTSRTVFISLRAREIKLIEMKVGHDRSVSATPTPSTSPGSFMDALERRSSYTTVIRKIFTPKSVSGNREEILWVAEQLEKLISVVTSVNNGGAVTTPQEKEQYNRVLFQTVLELLL